MFSADEKEVLLRLQDYTARSLLGMTSPTLSQWPDAVRSLIERGLLVYLLAHGGQLFYGLLPLVRCVGGDEPAWYAGLGGDEPGW